MTTAKPSPRASILQAEQAPPGSRKGCPGSPEDKIFICRYTYFIIELPLKKALQARIVPIFDTWKKRPNAL